MAGMGTKMIVIWLMIDAFLLIAPTAAGTGWITEGTPGEMMHHFVNTSIDDNDLWYNSTVTPQDDISQKMGLANDTGGDWSSGFVGPSLNLAAMAVSGGILFVKFLFAPVFYLQAVAAPFPVILILGVIPSILFVVSILNWLRGVDL